jgi:hypothetical protein
MIDTPNKSKLWHNLATFFSCQIIFKTLIFIAVVILAGVEELAL